VIDTNVLVSGLPWSGAPHALLTRVRAGTLSLVSSPAMLAELARVLSRHKFDDILLRSGRSRDRLLAEIHGLTELWDPVPLAHPVCRDPDDDALLALALAAQADCIISGDDDLLSLVIHEGMPILNVKQALLLEG
jgi:putative PIN family toxin of toxin-antitoxin system